MDPKTFFTRYNGEFDPKEFDEWVEAQRHSPKIIFPDGPIAREVSEFEARELVSLLESTIIGHHVLSPEHIAFEVLPNFLRCKFVDGRIDSEILLTRRFPEDLAESVIFRGCFKDGFPHGHFQVYDCAERLVEEYQLVFGVTHGEQTHYFQGIRTSSEKYKYNERHGQRRQYHLSGRLKTTATYEHGERVGPQQYFEDRD